MKNLLSFIIFTIFCLLLIFFLFKPLSTSWHEDHGKNSIVYGANIHIKDIVNVSSHRWKIIGPSDKNKEIYEWGWEVTLDIFDKSREELSFIGIKEIKYTLYDKDDFEIQTQYLDLEKYGSKNLKGDISLIIQQINTKMTYRQTSFLNFEKIKRAAYSKCIVTLG